MIGLIKGILEYKSSSYIIIDTNGVGYKINIPLSTYDALPETGEEVKIFTYLYVRDSTLDLYGFASLSEKEMFELVMKVSDIGPKLAINILSSIRVNNFKAAILKKDTSELLRIKGVGKKMADRLIIELKDKIEKISDTDSISYKGIINEKTRDDATEALVALGYNKISVRKALDEIEKNLDNTNIKIQDVIKKALRYL